MLKWIRNSGFAKGFLWVIILAFVATIFYSWGAGGEIGGANRTVATVNGMEIKTNEYERAYGNIINFYRDQFRGQFSEEMAAKLKLRENALDAYLESKNIIDISKVNLLWFVELMEE